MRLTLTFLFLLFAVYPLRAQEPTLAPGATPAVETVRSKTEEYKAAHLLEMARMELDWDRKDDAEKSLLQAIEIYNKVAEEYEKDEPPIYASSLVRMICDSFPEKFDDLFGKLSPKLRRLTPEISGILVNAKRYDKALEFITNAEFLPKKDYYFQLEALELLSRAYAKQGDAAKVDEVIKLYVEFRLRAAAEKEERRKKTDSRWDFDDDRPPVEGTIVYWGNALCLYQAGQHNAAKVLLEKAIAVIDRCFQNEEPDFYIANHYIAIAKAAIQMKSGDIADRAEAKARKIVDSLDREKHDEIKLECYFTDYDVRFRGKLEEVRQQLREAAKRAEPSQLQDIWLEQLNVNLLDEAIQTIEHEIPQSIDRLKIIVENEGEEWDYDDDHWDYTASEGYEDVVYTLIEKKMYWEALQMVIEKKLPFSNIEKVADAMYWDRGKETPYTVSEFTSGRFGFPDNKQLEELEPDWPQQSEHGDTAKEGPDCTSRGDDWEQEEAYWEPRFLPLFLEQISQAINGSHVEFLSATLSRILAQKGDIDAIITVLDAYEEQIKQIREILDEWHRKNHPYVYPSAEEREKYDQSKPLDDIKINFNELLQQLVDWGHVDEAIQLRDKYKARDDLDLYEIDSENEDEDIIVCGLFEKKRYDEALERIVHYADKEERDIAILDYCAAIAVEGQIDKAIQVISTFDTAEKRSWALFSISDQFRIKKKMDEMNAMKKLALDALDAIEDPETRKNQRWVYENTLDAAKLRSIGYSCLPGPIYGPYPHDPFRKQWSEE